jgi:hemolysin III
MSTSDSIICRHSLRPADERANFVTHALGLVLATAAAIFLMQRVLQTQSLRLQVSCGIYCLTLVTLYAASTLSHAFHDLRLRRFFRTVDQACIFVLIAGTFTPFALVKLWHGWWPALLATMWLLASLGVLMCLAMRNLTARARMSYLVIGWLPVICLQELAATTEPTILLWIIAGGACYCIGVIFLTLDHVRYFHAVWHLLVIAGGACHHLAITKYVVTI